MDANVPVTSESAGGGTALPIAPSRFSWISVWHWALILFGIAAVATAAKLLPMFLQDQGIWILRTLLSAAVISLVVALALRYYREWVIPRERMRELIHEVRMGRAPIEEFSQFQGHGLHSLVEEVKAVLHELKLQRQAVNELNEEVRTRIANRTSVMERTIAALRNQAARDGLTGLYNRRMLDELLPQLVNQCVTDKRALSLLMMDMDFFKELNDTLGHVAGDELLKSMGQIIHSTIRGGDMGFRYGGDEFVVLLPNCEVAPAQRVGERLQSLVQSLTATYKMTHRPGLSIGVGTLGELTEPTAANLIKRADERMYEFKSSRRSGMQAAKKE